VGMDYASLKTASKLWFGGSLLCTA